jgi:hypothetical protein
LYGGDVPKTRNAFLHQGRSRAAAGHKFVACNVLNLCRFKTFLPVSLIRTALVIMPPSQGPSAAPATFNLSEILRNLVDSGQTGYLKVKSGDLEGAIAVENGTILYAIAGTNTGLHALFQFVNWRDVQQEFFGRAMPANVARDLAVYDSKVLLEGIAFKEEEHHVLHQSCGGLEG